PAATRITRVAAIRSLRPRLEERGHLPDAGGLRALEARGLHGDVGAGHRLVEVDVALRRPRDLEAAVGGGPRLDHLEDLGDRRHEALDVRAVQEPEGDGRGHVAHLTTPRSARSIAWPMRPRSGARRAAGAGEPG